jgi:hypothetical protein
MGSGRVLRFRQFVVVLFLLAVAVLLTASCMMASLHGA